MKKNLTLLSAVAIACLLVLAIGCSKPQDSLVAAIDKHGDEIMASTEKAEARDWMKETNHIFFKEDPKPVSQDIEDFYNAGATQVLIADIEKEDGYDYGGALLVILPKDPAARTNLFQIGSRADTDFQNDPVTDEGQKYLYYSLD